MTDVLPILPRELTDLPEVHRPAVGADDEQRVFLVDLRTRPRYCRLTISGFSMNGSVSALAFFSRLANSDYTNEAIADTGGDRDGLVQKPAGVPPKVENHPPDTVTLAFGRGKGFAEAPRRALVEARNFHV